MIDSQTIKELQQYKQDRIYLENELNKERLRFAKSLKGDMGKDIDDVLSGKKIVKLSKWFIFKRKMKIFLCRLFGFDNDE